MCSEGLPDSKRVINSEEVQGVLRAKRRSRPAVNANKPRARLNPAAKIETKIQKRLHTLRTKENAVPKAKLAKNKAKKAKAKAWLGKVKGSLNKKGAPRTQQHQAKKAAKK